jgi:branched-chain amino acid aminotransferase
MKANVLYLNGEFIPGERGVVSVRTHAFAYGTACFEGIRGYWDEQAQQVYLFRAREHFARLLDSCRILQIAPPHAVESLAAIACELVRRNGYQQDVYLRPVAYKADLRIGVRLHDLADGFLIGIEPMGDYINTGGISCGVSSWRRIDDCALPARAKVCGAYVNSALAKSEALQNGYEEAIMLSHDGHVCEGSAENIFLVTQEGPSPHLVTPATTENILPGITRATIIELASRELGLATDERPVDRTELYVAQEIFLCGTGAQIAPVVQVDRRTIGSGAVGPVSAQLQQLYSEVVRGRRAEYRSAWCTPAYPATVPA